MGRYQQWLHYRAVDQQLYAQQEQLEQELATLHEQANLLKGALAMDNIIIQALARLYREIAQVGTSSAQSRGNVESAATPSSGDAVGQQSARTNYLIQRWMERWGRHSALVQELREDVQKIFAQLLPQDVEEFYQSYQYWQLQQGIAQTQAQIIVVQQQISENAEQMEQATPGTIALATFARLQASGVNDIDLLDRMLERGEAWLDHAMQLLKQCEDLKVFEGDYTRWCELALQGAYDWITSMFEADPIPAPQVAFPPASSSEAATEEMLLQKLMSDDELEQLPLTTDSTQVLTAIPVEETTKSEEAEVSSTEEPTLPEETTPGEASSAEEMAIASIEEPAPIEEIGEQEMSGDTPAVQASPSISEVLLQEREVNIPETPRPTILETESEEPETEEEAITVSQAMISDADEGIHAVEEIMYFTDEIPWQWEEAESSETHIPVLPDDREVHQAQDMQAVKPGIFHRLFRKKGTGND